MKKMLAFAAMALLALAAQAVNISWTNRNSYGSYGSAHTWNDNVNTDGTPVMTLNTSKTTANVYNSAFATQYTSSTQMTDPAFFSKTGTMTLSSIVLSAPNTSTWANNLPYLVLKVGDSTYISTQATVSTNKNFQVYNTSGTHQSSWNSMTFTFSDVTFVEGQDYKIYFASDANGTLMSIPDTALMLTGGNASGPIIFDAQISVQQLPEPTCLALLALGVAGIALKRKVA